MKLKAALFIVLLLASSLFAKGNHVPKAHIILNGLFLAFAAEKVRSVADALVNELWNVRTEQLEDGDGSVTCGLDGESADLAGYEIGLGAYLN